MSSTELLTGGAPLDMETGLQELIGRGYQFVHPRDEAGAVLAVVGFRVHDRVVDIVQLHAEDDVVAMRVPGSEQNVLSPQRMLWKSTGRVENVLEELLHLPDDRTPGAVVEPGGSVKGCWVPGQAGRAKWLEAS